MEDEEEGRGEGEEGEIERREEGREVRSSYFPRSLCFMGFWFGLEILRLV
jgi:hypothetical protein